MEKTSVPGGLLIAIDGIDGAGKTTLANSLGREMSAVGLQVTVSKEPTQGPWGMKLRNSAQEGRLAPEEELRLLVADRRQHVEEVVRPALGGGGVVILDRYYFSTVAYQGAAGIPIAQILAENSFAPAPDLYLLLDVDPATGIARIRGRGDKPNHFESKETLERCRSIFLESPAPAKNVIDAMKSAADVLVDCHALVLVSLADKIRQHDGLTADSVRKLEALLPAL